MFEKLLTELKPEVGDEPSEVWAHPALMVESCYREGASQIAGMRLGAGLFRLLDKSQGALLTRLVNEAFPEFSGGIVAFATDWLGRLFALDTGVRRATRIMLLEPGSGEAFEVPGDVCTFLGEELVDDPETYLERELFDAWRESGGEMPGSAECVGFKLPLFLGGEGTVENLEITDVEVYWDFCGQLRAATRGLPPGTTISGVQARPSQ